MTLVKICGLSTPGTVDAAVAAGATHLGFVFFAASPRNLSPERAAALIARVPAHVIKVGVFVDADDALLAHGVAAGLDVLQLHGEETPARVADVKTRFGRETWRAAGVRSRADIDEAAQAMRGVADRLLFDAKAPNGAPLPGGNGVRFDWRLLCEPPRGVDWGLSGGLDAATVAAAVAATRAPLVDVSSGVEDAPGVKSVAKIRAFVAAAGRA